MLALAVTPAFAQQVSPSTSSRPASASEKEDEPIVLSPFDVNADADVGYLASTAQSGTRLRTDLKDIASSISVVTKDFMNDIFFNDM